MITIRTIRCTSKNSRNIFTSQTIDLQNLEWFYAKQPPPSEIVEAARVAIEKNAFFNIKNHSLNTSVFSETKNLSKEFFDLDSKTKSNYAIYNMERSRGWEMYPQHRKFHATVTGVGAVLNKDSPVPKQYPRKYIESLKSHPEPSTREGIMCERFVVGPPEVCDLDTTTLDSQYYASEYGKIFYAQNVYPDEVPRLRPASYLAYKEFELLGRALLHIISLILGASNHTSLDPLFYDESNPLTPIRHHSRMQINNYPTIFENYFARFGPERANRHLDTSVLTILSRDGLTDNHVGRGGSLEILTPSTNQWQVVPIAPGELTVQTGSLCEYLSGGLVKGATHRVSNPEYCSKSIINRRFSISYVLKPDYLYPAAPISLLERSQFSPPYNYAEIYDPESVKKKMMPGFEAFPLIGEVGRVGWQNIQINNTGITREEAVTQFKSWKIEMRERLNMREKTRS